MYSEGKQGMTVKTEKKKIPCVCDAKCVPNSNMICQWPSDSLGVGRVHHAKNELNDCAVELQASAEQVLVQKAHVSTGFGSHQFLTGQSHTL